MRVREFVLSKLFLGFVAITLGTAANSAQASSILVGIADVSTLEGNEQGCAAVNAGGGGAYCNKTPDLPIHTILGEDAGCIQLDPPSSGISDVEYEVYVPGAGYNIEFIHPFQQTCNKTVSIEASVNGTWFPLGDVAAGGGPQGIVSYCAYGSFPSDCPLPDFDYDVTALRACDTYTGADCNGGGNVPSCTISVNPNSLPSSGGNATIQATCSNSPTNYDFYVNGAAWQHGSSSAWIATFQPNTAAVPQVWFFTVQASNAFGAGSVSAGAMVTVAAGEAVTYTVAPSAGANGSISPSTPQTVSSGATVQFTVTPNPGYTATVGGSCGGTLSDSVYSTNPITANCTVVASFNPTGNGVPVCTISVDRSELPSTGGNVMVSADCTNSPTGYTWSVDNVTNSVTSRSWTYAAPANPLSTDVTHFITVFAQNAAGYSQQPALYPITVRAAQTFSLDQHGLTGSWFNPATSGQGLEIEVYPDVLGAGQGVLFAGWFTYDAAGAGARRWYALQGNVSNANSSATLAIFTDVGGNLNAPPSVDPSGALGQATIQFSDCNTGSLTYNFTDGSGRTGTMPLSRITPNVTCSPGGDSGAAASDYLLSGNWFNPATSGQGLIFDLSPSLNLVFAAWYTFKPNGQRIGGLASQDWYTLQSDQFVPGISSLDNIPIVETNGGIFDNAAPTTRFQAGSADISFQNCNEMTLSYRFTAGENNGKAGSMDLVRVGPTPTGCTLP